jgi:O-antigen/teichoic acid export membrane protein
VPLFLRWYWPRLNGFGFAFGTAAGMTAGLLFKAGLGWPLFWSFPATILTALTVSVAAALLTKSTDRKILVDFWFQINPWGFWSRYAREAEGRGLVTARNIRERGRERLNDLIALAFALPFQVSLLIGAMALVFRDWDRFVIAVGVVAVTSVGLYVFWYRNLKKPDDCVKEDAYFDPLVRE